MVSFGGLGGGLGGMLGGGGGGGEMRMNYEQVQQMISSLKSAAVKLRDVAQAGEGMAKSIDNGALLGAAGQEFSGGIRGKLNTAIERLALKLEERATYLASEEAKLKSALADSAGEY